MVAEGIFAAEIIADLAAAGLLDRAICVRQATALTFARRLVRDLSERRKPPWVLARRGWRLARAEPEIVARHVARGARPMTPAQAERALTGAH